jgi:hypothetical protein
MVSPRIGRRLRIVSSPPGVLQMPCLCFSQHCNCRSPTSLLSDGRRMLVELTQLTYFLKEYCVASSLRRCRHCPTTFTCMRKPVQVSRKYLK